MSALIASINAANRRHYAGLSAPRGRTADVLLAVPTQTEQEKYFRSRANNDPGKVWNGDPSPAMVATLIKGLGSLDADEREQLGTALEAKGYLPPGWRRNFGGVASTDALRHLGSLTRDAMRDVATLQANNRKFWNR